MIKSLPSNSMSVLKFGYDHIVLCLHQQMSHKVT
jgi:hypothetical protein